MVMFSKFRTFALRDEGGRHAKLVDLAIDLLDSDYPPITQLFFRNEAGEQVRLPWEAVQTIEWRRREITVSNLEAGPAASEELLAQEVLLRRDVIDALVLDLQNRRATRANDLWLEREDGRLLLKAVDTSARAVLRRLSRGRFGGRRTKSLYDWKYVEFLRGDPLAVRNGAGYRMRINRLPPGEIAGLSTRSRTSTPRNCSRSCTMRLPPTRSKSCRSTGSYKSSACSKRNKRCACSR